MARPNNKIMGRVDFQQRRENAMRPSRFLGYDHDEMGVYFLDKQSPSLAETEFRRAVWLNPFEPEFKAHLAMCLFQRQRYVEAKDFARQVLELAPHRRDIQRLITLAEARAAAAPPPPNPAPRVAHM